MTKRKAFKKRVREHMSKTGKSYTAARGDLESKAARESLTFRKLKYECFRIENGAKRRILHTLRYAVERDVRSYQRKDDAGTSVWIYRLPLLDGFEIHHNTLMTNRPGTYSEGFCFSVEQPGDSLPSLEWFAPMRGNVFQGAGRVRLTVAKRAEHAERELRSGTNAEDLVAITFLEDTTLGYSEDPFVVRKGSVFQMHPDPAPEERYVFPKVPIKRDPEKESAEAGPCSFCGIVGPSVMFFNGGDKEAQRRAGSWIILSICSNCVDGCHRAGETQPTAAGGLIPFHPPKLGPLYYQPAPPQPPLPLPVLRVGICHFCGYPASDARRLFVGEFASICSECLTVCDEILSKKA
jgi:hypothetical protein